MTVVTRLARRAPAGPRRTRPLGATDALLACGIAFPALYALVNDALAASRYHGYRRLDQAVSELSAAGAPTRPLLVAMSPVFTALEVAYGVGVGRAARGRRGLRAASAMLVSSGAANLAWLPFPMSRREDIARGAASKSDVGHLVLTAVTVSLILALLGSGSVAFGTRFRIYSLASALAVVAAGTLTSVEAAKLSSGRPTPRMGLYERISIGAWLLWMAVLAAILLGERGRTGAA